MSGRLELRLPNELAATAGVAEQLERFGAEQRLPTGIVNALNVVLDEVLSNIIRHGYQAGVRGEIVVRLERQSNCVVLEVEDRARAFDPHAAAAPDLTSPMMERRVGGLGVHLIKTLMDEVSYVRVGNTNVLRLVKNTDTK